VGPLSCAKLSVGSILGFQCWNWKLCPELYVQIGLSKVLVADPGEDGMCAVYSMYNGPRTLS
jgi:hypothetical protein